MIAIITSTIFPPSESSYWNSRKEAKPEERFEQTLETIQSLIKYEIEHIYLCDNSGYGWTPELKDKVKPVELQLFGHYQFRNYGISELYMLKKGLCQLPEDESVLKISGRYRLTKDPRDYLGDADVAGRLYNPETYKKRTLSTALYCVKNSKIFSFIVDQALREIYASQCRIVGPGSLFRILKNSISRSGGEYSYEDPNTSIEGAIARVIKIKKLKVRHIPSLGIQGYQCGDPERWITE